MRVTPYGGCGRRQRGDRMTSIKDVARPVGVSTATVSRALRGLPRVSDETRVRVLQGGRASSTTWHRPARPGWPAGRPARSA